MMIIQNLMLFFGYVPYEQIKAADKAIDMLKAENEMLKAEAVKPKMHPLAGIIIEAIESRAKKHEHKVLCNTEHVNISYCKECGNAIGAVCKGKAKINPAIKIILESNSSFNNLEVKSTSVYAEYSGKEDECHKFFVDKVNEFIIEEQ